ncbi:MAG: lipopolysaccharide biosynthesis protein, partial [Chloroflexi bacterium]|nr:lipopolysaccharide biosynthesis protein [Chloroflexota bacterium]
LLNVSAAGQVAVLEATFASGRWSMFAMAGAALRFVLPLALFGLLGPASALLWGAAIEIVATWIVRDWLQRRHIPMVRVGWREMWRIWTETARYGAAFALTGIGDQTLAFSDRFIIGALIGPAAVGLYSTNYSIAEKLLILVQAPLIYAATPRVTSLWENNARQEAVDLIRTALRWLTMMGAPVVAFALVRGDFLSGLLLGQKYVEAHAVIPIVTASILLWAASQYGHVSFQLGKITWIISLALLCAAAANAVAVFALTSTIGYIGGALGTGIGYLTYAVIIFIASRRRGPLPWNVPWSTVAHAACSAAVAAIVWRFVVPDRLGNVMDFCLAAVGGMIGLGVYLLLLVVFAELALPRKGGASFASILSLHSRRARPAEDVE